ncbi:MAG: hypothetical protein QM783_19905 [Phycisphaerales bacterium]
MVQTDSSKPNGDVRSRVRVEVLRVTDEGIVIRGTDNWKGTDVSVRPQPRGVEKDRTDEMTFDVLIPSDGSGLKAVDREAALDEIIGSGRADQIAKGLDEAKIKRVEEMMRNAMSDPAVVDHAAYRQFAVLFDRLGAAVTTGEATPVVNERGVMGYSLKITTTASATVESDGNAVRRVVELVPAEEHRSMMRAVFEREAKAQKVDMKIMEPIIKERLEKERDTKDTIEVKLELARGWPVSTVMIGDKTSKGESFVTKRTFTLVQGPDPAVPAPSKNAADESGVAYIEWLADMLKDQKQPLRMYARVRLDEVLHPTAEQRAMLLERAASMGEGVEGEVPPAVTLGDAGSAGLKESDGEKLIAAYAKLSPVGRSAVLVNVIGRKEPSGAELFRKLLAAAPTEKDLRDLPLDSLEDEPELMDRELGTACLEPRLATSTGRCSTRGTSSRSRGSCRTRSAGR